ncbi:MAG: UDP-N-acetylglucosamine 1-carboxyvinyltransferase, partial [Firmicutes bacterium]|nr:UDP-N-acetylglucosamine 1-carboxyvinyltransferase [Candidatus Colimorpha enterica]
MQKIVINGGKPLIGEIEVSGMKNAALPILMGSLLTEDICTIENLPQIDDVALTLEILRRMGAKVTEIDANTVTIDSREAKCGTSPASLAVKMRASYYLVGVELGRYGYTKVHLPGGCDFGARPIDQHLKGFEALGADMNIDDEYIVGQVGSEGLNGANIFFDMITVGGTMNVMLAAVKANGTTIIDNAAREPHIVDLANFLNTCGAKISGAGTDTIKIKGVKKLHGCSYTIIPDMIEAGTYMLAAAATKGDLLIKNVIPKHLDSISAKLTEMGAEVIENDESVRVICKGRLRGVNVKAMPYPGFPTDMQPQICVLLAISSRTATLIDGVYENRFRYVDQLIAMGADIERQSRLLRIW